MAQKSKILVIGATGYIGKYIVVASAKAGHPTFALVRESTASNPEKSHVIESFKSSGVTLLYVCFHHLAHVLFDNLVQYFDLENHAGFSQGDIYHHESLLKAIKQVDIVISTVGSQQIADQAKIIAAIKEAGNIKASHLAG
jgi:putative NADH-flavin reductase